MGKPRTEGITLNRRAYERVRKMDHAKMQHWANTIYQQGVKNAQAVQLTREELEAAVSGVKGIGKDRASAAAEAVLQAMAEKRKNI